MAYDAKLYRENFLMVAGLIENLLKGKSFLMNYYPFVKFVKNFPCVYFAEDVQTQSY